MLAGHPIGYSLTVAPSEGIDRSRYRRVRRFFARVLVHAVWWDVILNRPLLRRLRHPALDRYRKLARDYRSLAVELGGVLIKLGQFLSTRVDVIPPEVIAELAGLQDEVPAGPSEEIVRRIEEELGRPIGDLFASFDRQAVGSASLAQVHAARLADGTDVVVKVLRPRIDVLVETDLAAFAKATRWMNRWRALRRRVDIAWIEREFTAVTRRELDLEQEGRNAERFARNFADDDRVVVPRVHWQWTRRRCLTLDNVAGIKISRPDLIRAAGVDPADVARFLYDAYMRQFFVTHMVHADPHPGNLFVHPLSEADGDPHGAGRRFRVAFVDFGMVTVIPERLREALRTFAIGLGTRDPRRIVDSYVTAGTLLPGADLERLIEAHRVFFDRFWGVRLADMRDVALAEGQQLAIEFRDLLLEAPIQLQADMLFAMRAVGILAGLCTSLDPEFDPWELTVPFAKRFAREQDGGSLVGGLGDLVRHLVRLPGRLDRIAGQLERDEIGVRASLDPEARHQIQRLEDAVVRFSWTVAASAALLSAVLLVALRPEHAAIPWLLGGAAVAGAIGLLRRR